MPMMPADFAIPPPPATIAMPAKRHQAASHVAGRRRAYDFATPCRRFSLAPTESSAAGRLCRSRRGFRKDGAIAPSRRFEAMLRIAATTRCIFFRRIRTGHVNVDAIAAVLFY